ncbi:LRR receptor-like serine/threonine-protein kinase IOS1 [Phaseolus vulgaris]|uniref:LRR receptor-like serine/threonine-protein kinase IOS1 n=1 Tax=Phaseolus vulgaris TaxID=3885 RepID=UPI0035CB53B4
MVLVYLSPYRVLVTFFIASLCGLLIQAQNQAGFISIDCGASADEKYTEESTGIDYISDANFITTGVSKSIASDLKGMSQQQMWNVRSFPEGRRNCYKINITINSKYLIRTVYLYGNYDGLNKTPKFGLLLGPNFWHTVTIHNASIFQYNEIIHVPTQDYVQICLVDTGLGTPFISAIELRTLTDNLYVQSGSWETQRRWDLGSNKSYRYKDDRYDRYWEASDINDSTKLSVSISDKIIITESEYHPPAIVMSTAVTAVNANAPLVISWEPENETDQFYVYMHFMDVQVLTTNQTRRFNVMLNGKLWYANCSPLYMGGNSIGGPTGLSGKEIKFSLERTENSTLPPIINAIESYRLIESHQSVDAITRIKSVYGVKRDWQGDPCAPATYLWDGLNCTYGDNEVPRITTLNLSSSGLSGNIDTSISNLIMLEKLDLSNNNLTGEVPDFLIQLQHLKILNLEKNDLSGSIPSSLIEKSHEGSLSLSVGQNPNLCESGECNETKKKNIVTPILLVSISGVLILLIAVAILWICKRKKSKDSVAVNHQNKISQQSTEKDDSLQSRKSQMYSYNDVLQITNNFNRIIGKGGFGTVYLGFINNTPVAVKMLSPSAVHGYKQFQAEVKLLIRVHHKNLTSLIGYCNEETNKALIYEYMAKGNLREHLSGKYNESPFLSWKERLRVAVDTAQGLEYLQNGCKPPIIHRDVKSTNILLDEHFQAKLSDFGLSKVVPDDGGSHVSTIVAGTVGYLDPHYHSSNRLTQKSDVYSFGVVLLEIITNQSVTGRNEENGHISERVSSMIPTGDIRAIVDSRLEGNFDINSAWKALEIAMACVSRNPNERPMMSVVVIELQETLATELARTEHNNGADPKYSVAAWSESELMPLAR